MQRDKEAVAALMREKQKKGNFHSPVATYAASAFPNLDTRTKLIDFTPSSRGEESCPTRREQVDWTSGLRHERDYNGVGHQQQSHRAATLVSTFDI